MILPRMMAGPTVALCNDIPPRQSSRPFRLRTSACLLALALLLGCGKSSPEARHLLLVSIDGFRWDYLQRAQTPHLDSLAAAGVRAEALIGAFPTKTYPNHYTLATGLYPENHGIVANTIFDPVLNDTFRLADRRTVRDGQWYGGEPIWVTAEKYGVKSASLFWPGTEAVIKGRRPTYWQPYDHELPPVEVVGQALTWLDLPLAQRPNFISLYFHLVDDAGHRHPDSVWVEAAVERIDSTLGLLFAGLAARGLAATTNIMITSDHGMTAVDTTRIIFLDDYVDPALLGVIDWAPALALRPGLEFQEAVYSGLRGAHPRLHIYRRDEVPERYHYSSHYRIPPIIGITDLGWQVTTRARFRADPDGFTGGAHGYDPANADMQAIFIASGPGFKRGLVTPPLENIHLYELMCRLLGVPPALNDGSLERVSYLLR